MASPILLLSRKLGIGGSERQTVEMAKTLDRGQFEVHVGCFYSDGMRADELRSAGIPILELPVRSFFSRSALAGASQLLRYIRDHRIELVHSFDVPMNLYAAPLAWLARRPVVVTSQRAHRLLTPGIPHWLLRATDRLADGIVVNCEFMRRHLLEDEKVPAELVHVCYNGIDTERFRPAARRADQPLTIGTVCVLRPEKGLETLVRAFALCPGVQLLIVGSGPELKALTHLAEEVGLSDRCTFRPAVDDVTPSLGQIDIFVLPSRSEAFSNSLMEAMACGCCPVASNVGGNPELASNLFEAGNVEDLARLLNALIGEPARIRALGDAASKFVRERFSVRASADRLGEIYRQLLGKCHPTP